MFIAHAYLKLVIFTPAGFTGFLGQVGLPGFLAWPIMLAELIGGIAILIASGVFIATRQRRLARLDETNADNPSG